MVLGRFSERVEVLVTEEVYLKLVNQAYSGGDKLSPYCRKILSAFVNKGVGKDED